MVICGPLRNACSFLVNKGPVNGGHASNCGKNGQCIVKAVIIGPDVAKATTSGPGVATISEPVVLTMHILSFVLGSGPCKIANQLLFQMGVGSAGGTDHINSTTRCSEVRYIM